MSILLALRQRKLVQWLLAYLAGAWLILEVISLLAANLQWSPLVFRVTLTLLAVGLLAALVLAWYHGERGEQRASTVELLMMAGILVIAAAAVMLVREAIAPPKESASSPATPVSQTAVVLDAANDSADQTSLAVLPFADLSPASDQEYFSDGITEEILHALAQVPGLRVPGRTTSFSYKGRNLPIAQIAGELNVAYVLEGSVRRAGDQLRITTQLIDARTDTHLWSQTYDRELANVFALQEEIARAIADRLQLQFSGSSELAISARSSVHPLAYTLYLQGRQLWNRREITGAISYFAQAAALDPAFAQAHSALAESYVLLPTLTGAQPREAFALVEEFAQRGLALNPGLSSAHAARGFMLTKSLRWAEADAAFGKALNLNPSDPIALTWYCGSLMTRGSQQGEAQCKAAVSSDPAYATANANLAAVYVLQGRLQEAEELFLHTLTLLPGYGFANEELLQLYVRTERFEEALRVIDELTTSDFEYAAIGGVGYGLAKAGREAQARRVLVQIEEEEAAGKSTSAWAYALVLTGLGEGDKALTTLEEWGRQEQPVLSGGAIHPFIQAFDPIRDDPRFQAVITRWFLPD